MIDSRESVAKMATAELDLSKAVDLARVAQGAAVVTGQNSSDVFAKLVQGIATGQTILLHHQGIMVNLEDAYKAYAKQLGVTKDLLTETDKRQAALNAVLDFGARYAGVYEAAMRQEAIDRAGVVDAESLYLGLINKNFSYLQSLFDAIPGNIEKAQNASSEHLQELYIANYVSKLQDAAGGEDAFKTVMSKILYPFVTGLAVVSPCDCGLTVAEIAQKDVPAGVPYRIVEDADLPTDGSPQSA